MPNVDINGKVVFFPDDLSVEELNQAVSLAASQISSKPSVIPSVPSTPPGLMERAAGYAKKGGTVLLNTLGAPNEMAGEAIRVARDGYPFRLPTIANGYDVNNRWLTNQKKPSEFVSEITGGIQGLSRLATAPIEGKNPLQAAAEEIRRPKDQPMDLVNQLAFSVAAPSVASAPLTAAMKIANPILKAAGKTAALINSGQTNVPPRDYETVFNNPSSILPGTMSKAKQVYQDAKEAAGIPNNVTVDQANILKNPKKYVFDTYKRIMSGEAVTPKEALYARNGLDLVRPQPNAKNGALMNVFDQMRDKFQEVIKEVPEIREADRVYGPAKAASKFKSLVPMTSTGKPGFIRGGAMAGLLYKGQIPVALSMSPIVAGTATAGLGAAKKGLDFLLQNPVARQSIMAAFLNKRNQQ